VKRWTGVALVALAALVAAVDAGSGRDSDRELLALTGGTLGHRSRLVEVDRSTLAVVRARALTLPGTAFGLEWSRSPNGRFVALAPKPSDQDEHVFVVDASRLRIIARTWARYLDVCRLAWPAPRRLLVLATSPRCYQPREPLTMLVVDPLRGRVVARRRLAAPGSIVAGASTARGLAVLLGPPASVGPSRLVLASSSGQRTIRLSRVRAGLPPVAGRASRIPGLAVDRQHGRGYVVDPSGSIVEVDLATGTVRTHHPQPAASTAAAAKGVTGSVVHAVWVGDGVLAFARNTPRGLWLVDTRTWRRRLVDPIAGAVAASAGIILAFSGDSGGGDGISGYDLSGRRLFRALADQSVALVRVSARYVYAATANAGYVMTLPGGTVAGYPVDTASIWDLLARES
jgi:hypothetical protein